MFERVQKMRERQENGFTLIELLVVILIIAILAAIAIPVFLKQREKAWTAEVQSALHNAATAEESYLVDNAVYTTNENDLGAQGFKKGPDVSALTITTLGGTSYCIDASSTNTSTVHWEVSSDDSTPTQGTCGSDGVKG